MKNSLSRAKLSVEGDAVEGDAVEGGGGEEQRWMVLETWRKDGGEREREKGEGERTGEVKGCQLG